MQNEQIEWVIFDLGNVLVRVDRLGIFSHLSKHLSKPVSELTDHFNKLSDIWLDISVKEISTKELPNLMQLDLDANILEQALNSELYETIVETERILASLKGRHNVACLSNTNTIHWRELWAKYPFMKLFDVALASQELALAKPDIAIYERACEVLKTKPDRCIFFDDNFDNIESAKKAGWNAYLFSGDHEEMKAQFAKHGIKV